MKLRCSKCDTQLIVEPKLQTETEYRVRPCAACMYDLERVVRTEIEKAIGKDWNDLYYD